MYGDERLYCMAMKNIILSGYLFLSLPQSSFLHLHLISYFIILSPTNSPLFYIIYYLTHLSSIVANPSPPNCTCTCTCILSLPLSFPDSSPSSGSGFNSSFCSVIAPDSSSDKTLVLVLVLIPDCGPRSKYGLGCCVT